MVEGNVNHCLYPKASHVLKSAFTSIPRRVCGVYFLIRNDEVVYVGQSRNILARVIQHAEGEDSFLPDKVFDSYWFIECAEPDLDGLERKWIEFFDPIDNCSHTKRKPNGQSGRKNGFGLYLTRLRRERKQFGTGTILDLAIPYGDQLQLAWDGILTVRKLKRNPALREKYKDALQRFDFYHPDEAEYD